MIQAFPDAQAPQRVRAEAAVSFRTDATGRTRLHRLRQDGSAKIRLPRVHRSVPEAVLINSAGGLTGGDRIAWTAEAGPGASVTLTSQACERAYRALSDAPPAEQRTRLVVGEGARLHWLPQELILFDRAALHRTLDVDMAADARLLAVEAVVLGREAMGETVAACRFRDRWRIRRDGRLVHAEDVRLDRGWTGPAALGSARAWASLVYLGPEGTEEMEAMARTLRTAFDGAPDGTIGGASALPGRVVARLVAPSMRALRLRLEPALRAVRGCPMPCTWRT